MSEAPKNLRQFSIAGILFLMAMTAMWLGLFPTLLRLKPIIDPVFLGVLFTSACAMCFVTFLGRKGPQFRTLVFLSCVFVAFCGAIIASIFSRY